MTALDNNFNFDPKKYSSLDKEFDSKKSLVEFLDQMAQIQKDIDPRFLDMFKDYEARVSALLSENLPIASSEVVQKELTRQNARVARAFQRDSIKLQDAYKKVFGELDDNKDYGGL